MNIALIFRSTRRLKNSRGSRLYIQQATTLFSISLMENTIFYLLPIIYSSCNRLTLFLLQMCTKMWRLQAGGEGEVTAMLLKSALCSCALVLLRLPGNHVLCLWALDIFCLPSIKYVLCTWALVLLCLPGSYTLYTWALVLLCLPGSYTLYAWALVLLCLPSINYVLCTCALVLLRLLGNCILCACAFVLLCLPGNYIICACALVLLCLPATASAHAHLFYFAY
jgi:hypothetical protein